MDLKECYAAIDGDYQGVMDRMLHKEELVRRFALKFLGDGSYALLQDSLRQKNYEEAFRAAHTIKGVCQNLGFTRLYESSSRLTEALRGGWSPEADSLLAPVERDYQATVEALQSLQR